MALPWRVRRPSLPADVQRRVEAWQRLPPTDLRRDAASARWVVVDTETSGLDPGSDRLLCVGAVAVEAATIRLEQSFEARLLQERASDTANILVHGIGAAAQRGGVPAAPALATFLEFAGNDPLVAFHAPFDAAFLRRAARSELGVRFAPLWLDAEALARASFPDAASRGWGLDEWLRQMRIPALARHSALADAYSTAQLFLALLARARETGPSDVRTLVRLEHSARALARWS